MADAELSGNGTGSAAEMQCGTLPGRAADFQFLPGDSVLDAGAERLRGCLFGGKAGRETLRGSGSCAAIRDLIIGKDTPQEAIAVAFDGLRNARYLDEIDSRAQQHVATVAQGRNL